MEPSVPNDPEKSPDVPRRREPAYALVYAALVPVLGEIGREHGYAVAVHGSMATDLDLLCCPWTDAATDAETLVEAIRVHLNCIFVASHHVKSAKKPHGRLAWSLVSDPSDGFVIGGPYLDISVMPRLLAPVSTEEAQNGQAPATTAPGTAIDEQETMPRGLIDVIRRVGQGVAPHTDPDGLLSAIAGLSVDEFERFRAHWSRWAEGGAPCTRHP